MVTVTVAVVITATIFILVIVGLGVAAYIYIRRLEKQQECPDCNECTGSNFAIGSSVSLIMFPNLLNSSVFMGICQNDGKAVVSLVRSDISQAQWTVEQAETSKGSFALKASNGNYLANNNGTIECTSTTFNNSSSLSLVPSSIIGLSYIKFGTGNYLAYNSYMSIACIDAGPTPRATVRIVNDISSASLFLLLPRQ